jgi:succinate dehydrogenase assembly factor 1
MLSCNESMSLMHSRKEFRKNIDVGKKDFGTIEYLLRRGRNQLETYSDPGIRDIHV